MKLLITSLTLLTILTGCGTSDGACCDSAKVLSANQSPDTPFLVKSEDPIENPDTKNNLGENGGEVAVTNPPLNTLDDDMRDPTAVISSDIPEEDIRPGHHVTFSCDKSHDNDEDGKTIVSCEWSVVCHKKDGYECKCKKKLKPGKTFYLTPHPNSKAMTVTLTVTDDENKTDTKTVTYDFE